MTLSTLRLLAAERPLPMRVVGSSMAPRLRDGEVVAIEPAHIYIPGDVIAFRRPKTGQLLLHRLLGYRPVATKWVLILQGDTCSSHDGVVFAEHIVGRVVSREGDGCPFSVSLADRVQALGRWWRLARGWLVRRLA